LSCELTINFPPENIHLNTQPTSIKMAETHHFDASKLFDVSGFVCVVTGGGTGIGLMCSQALAANGAKVSCLAVSLYQVN